MTTEFNGSIQDAIITMISNQTDTCEVAQTIDDVEVTVEIVIKKIVDNGVVMYDVTGEAAE